MPPEFGDGLDRAICTITRMTGWAFQVMRFVHDEEVDIGLHGLCGQFGPLEQKLQPDDHLSVGLEWVEASAIFLLDVKEALLVEQDKHLVVFTPQFAEPLYR